MLMTALWLLGCGGVSSTGGSFPIHAYPEVPMAVSQPHEVWIPCSTYGTPEGAIVSKMYCVKEDAVLELQGFVRELDSIIRKYEYATQQINKGN